MGTRTLGGLAEIIAVLVLSLASMASLAMAASIAGADEMAFENSAAQARSGVSD
jgi:hypothetical protein